MDGKITNVVVGQVQRDQTAQSSYPVCLENNVVVEIQDLEGFQIGERARELLNPVVTTIDDLHGAQLAKVQGERADRVV